MLPYCDLLLRIGARCADGAGAPDALGTSGSEAMYPVTACLNDGSVFDGGRLYLEREALNRAALEQDARAYGLRLSRAIFTGPINDALQRAKGVVEHSAGRYAGVRVRVAPSDDAPELHSVAWELLHQPEQRRPAPLATSADSPFSRYVDLPRAHPLRARSGPVRILVVIAHPSGVSSELLRPIDVSAEIARFQRVLDELPSGAAAHVSFMPGRSGLPAAQRRELAAAGHTLLDGPSSLKAIARALQRGEHHVLHVLCHGHFDPVSHTSTLHLENQAGGWDPVADARITNAMRGLPRRPRLFFLAACESATRAESDAFCGLAPGLVHAQIPAVVAMQDQLRMDDAHTLTSVFYGNLLAHGVVDLALNQARNALYDSARLNWGVAVLYTRLRDGRLFPARKPGAWSWPAQLSPRRSSRLLRASAVLSLVPLALYWLGARAHRGRELLIGIPHSEAFSYPLDEILITGARAVLELLLYMLIGPFLGVGIEGWAAPILALIAGGTWWLYRRGCRRWLFAALVVLWPVLGFGAVFHAHAARVERVVMPSIERPMGTMSRGEHGRASVPDLIRFEVASWLRNPTDINANRRRALAGLSLWYAFALLVLACLGKRAAGRGADASSLRRALAWGLLALYGLSFCYVVVQIPRVYAAARWGLAYPKVVGITTNCGVFEATRLAVHRGECQAVDISSGAKEQTLLFWDACEQASVSTESRDAEEAASDVHTVRLVPRAGSTQSCTVRTRGMQTILNWKDS